jgi:anti-sigma B factor antagonist
MSLSINIRTNSGIMVVDVSGRITLGDGAATLRETLRAMPHEGHKRVLLNLADTSHIDSSGLGVLVAAFASMAHHGGQLKLVNLNNRVKDLLLVTKLFTVFEVFDDETFAVRSFTEVAAGALGGPRF